MCQYLTSLFRGVAGLSLPIFLGVCGAPPPQADLLTVAVEADPSNLDPRFGTDQASARFYQLVYSGLVRFDERLQPAADLAESWELSDPRTLRLRLRAGVTFHDGRPLTSADVRYTIESILDPRTGSPFRGEFEVIERVTTPDEQTVVLRLSRPFAPLLANLNVGMLAIVPADSSIDHRRHPVGTGPFRFVQRRRDEEVILEANPGYWEGAPPFRTLRLRVVPTENGRALELLKGSVDVVVNDLSAATVERFASDPRFTVLSSPSTRYSYVGFNMEDPVLGRAEVRRAIAHAVDREALIRHHLRGRARPATGILSPLLWGYHDPGSLHPHDAGRARRLLDQAGLTDPDGPGPRPRFALQYKCAATESALALATILQDQLHETGIQLELRSYEWATFYDDIVHGRFQLFALRWTTIVDPDVMRLRFHSAMVPPRGFNRGRYRNPELDRLLEEGASETDAGRRARLYARCQVILATDLPYLSLWHEDNVAVLRRRVAGFQLLPNADFSAFAAARPQSDPVLGDASAAASSVARGRRESETAAPPAAAAPKPLPPAAAAAGPF
jgi:peptide/nickel transport system substrate-binding protein